MPVRKRKGNEDALDTALEELKKYALDFKILQGIANKRIEAKELEDAAQKAKNLFMSFQHATNRITPRAVGLDEYLDEVINITKILSGIAKDETKRYAPPNEYMRILTSSFEKFVSRIANKKTRERMRKAVSFIPVIEGVVSSCGGIPYYFEHAGRYEKAAMILSAVLLLTALAMTIAIYTSPALIGIPFLATAIAGCVLFSRILYDQAAVNAKKSYESKPRVELAAEKLAVAEDDLRAFRDNHIDSDRRTMIKTEEDMYIFVDETFNDPQFRKEAKRGETSKVKRSYINYGNSNEPYRNKPA